MTAPRPITARRVAELLDRRGVAYDEAFLSELVEACKRASKAPKAIQVVQEYCEYTPPQAFWESMEANVTDLALWERVVSAYVMQGWSKQNLSNMFEFYKRGEVPATTKLVRGDAVQAQPKGAATILAMMQREGVLNVNP